MTNPPATRLYTAAEMETCFRRAMAKGVATGRTEERASLEAWAAALNAKPTPEPQPDDETATFSDFTPIRPSFAPEDAKSFASYFTPDADGHYPGVLHRRFGLGVKAFADATGLQQRGHRRGWVWTAKPDANATDDIASDGYPADTNDLFGDDVKAFAGRTGLVLKDVTDKNGRKSKRWVRSEPKPASKPRMPKAEEPAAKPKQPTPKPDKSANHADVRAMLADPSKLTHDHLPQLAEKLKGLTVEQIKGIQAERGAKGGAVKGDRIAKLLDHVRGKLGAGNATPPAATPSPQPDSQQPPAAAAPPLPPPPPDTNKPQPGEVAAPPVAGAQPAAASPHPARAALTALGIPHDTLTDEDIAAKLKAAFATPTAKPAAKPTPAANPKLDDAEKSLTATLKQPNDDAAADRIVADLQAQHTPDEFKELVRRVSGKPKGRVTPAEQLKTDLTAVHRLLESQNV